MFVSLQTATLYPAVVFCICFVLNCFIWGEHSSGAVSISSDRKSHAQAIAVTNTYHFSVYVISCTYCCTFQLLGSFHYDAGSVVHVVWYFYASCIPGLLFRFPETAIWQSGSHQSDPSAGPWAALVHEQVCRVCDVLYVVCDVTWSNSDINAKVFICFLFLASWWLEFCLLGPCLSSCFSFLV